MVSYDVPYEVSYRGSYGEVNRGAGQITGREMISPLCRGGILPTKMRVIPLYQESRKGGVRNDRKRR